MTKTRVEISYTGIVGFVPCLGGYRVVVQNADGHVAWIVVRKGFFKQDPANSWGKPLKEYADHVAYALDGCDVEVNNFIIDKGLRIDASFLQWTLRLADGVVPTNPGSDTMDGKYLSIDDPYLISARLHVIAGELRANRPSEDYVWRWVGSGKSWRRIAQLVTNSFDIDCKELELWCGTRKKLLVWGENGGPATVLVGNTPLADIFPHSHSHSHSDEPIDTHVRMYYDLSAVSYPTEFRPGLARRPAQGPPKIKPASVGFEWGILRLGGSNCPPGLWTA